MRALCVNAGGRGEATSVREPQRRLRRRAYLPVASQTVQSGPCRRLALCQRITPRTPCAPSPGRPTSNGYWSLSLSEEAETTAHGLLLLRFGRRDAHRVPNNLGSGR